MKIFAQFLGLAAVALVSSSLVEGEEVNIDVLCWDIFLAHDYVEEGRSSISFGGDVTIDTSHFGLAHPLTVTEVSDLYVELLKYKDWFTQIATALADFKASSSYTSTGIYQIADQNDMTNLTNMLNSTLLSSPGFQINVMINTIIRMKKAGVSDKRASSKPATTESTLGDADNEAADEGIPMRLSTIKIATDYVSSSLVNLLGLWQDKCYSTMDYSRKKRDIDGGNMIEKQAEALRSCEHASNKLRCIRMRNRKILRVLRK